MLASAPSSTVVVRRPNPLGAAGADLLVVLALLGACFAVYGQTLGFGFINLDDPGYVLNNPMVSRGLSWAGAGWAFTTFTECNWHPLTWLSLMADAQFYGLNAGGYHLTSLLLHGLNCTLLYVWLRRATGTLWPGAIVAFFFAVHPLHVESVAWISERKDVLSLLFGLLTLIAHAEYARHGKRAWRRASLAFFAAGLASKPMLVTLPLLLLLSDVWPLDRIGGRTWRERLWEKAPFFALAAASAVVTLVAQRAGHAVVPYRLLPASERLGSAVTAGAVYLGETLWPTRLGVYYPYWVGRPIWQSLAALTLLAAITVGAWRARRRAPYVAVGWAWFLVALAPVIGIVQVGGQAMADRYTYLPHVGLFIALVWAGADVAGRLPRWRLPLIAAVALAGVGCLGLGVSQASYWRDSVTLFARTYAVTRPSPNLCTLYGDACLSAGRYAEAESVYRKGLELRPGSAAFEGKLGYAQLRRGELADALSSLTAAERAAPDEETVLCNLARTLARLGRAQEAAEAYRRCARANPRSGAAALGLADTLLGLGQSAQAAAAYDATLQLQSTCIPALTRLAWLLASGVGNELPADPTRALALAERAVALSRGTDMDSLDALAVAQAVNGQWEQATATARQALAAAQHSGAPAPVIEIRQERVERYGSAQLPQR